VLSGGGNQSVSQVGMLRALIERDIVPDVVIGTSAGGLAALSRAAGAQSYPTRPVRIIVATSAGGSTDITTFDFPSYGRRMRDAEAVTRSKTEILDLLEKEGEAFAAFLGGLSDAQLSEQVLGNGANGKVHRSRLEMLLSAKEHEMHHRGQLMLLQRMIGVVPHLTREREARMRPQPTR